MARVWAFGLFGLAVSFAACSAELIGNASDDPPDGGGDGGLDGTVVTPEGGGDDAADASTDAPPTKRCTPQSPLEKVIVLALASEDLRDDRHPTMNAAETELFFASTRTALGRYPTLYRATRMTPSDPFSEPQVLSGLAPSALAAVDSHSSLSVDGLSLVFSTNRNATSFDVWVARRSTPTSATFGSVDPVSSGVNETDLDENGPTLDSSGVLWFTRTVQGGGAGGRQLIYTAQPKVGSPSWTDVAEMTPLNDALYSTGKPVLSIDRLTLYFATNREHPNMLADYDIWAATRTTANEAFGKPAIVADLATSFADVPGWLSPDGCRLYFDRGTPNGARIFVAVRTP